MNMRIGKFFIPRLLIERAIENPDCAAAAEINAIMAAATPFDACYEAWADRVVYSALSRSFDVIAGGEAPPMYEVILGRKTGYVGHVACETYDVKFVRVGSGVLARS